MSPRLTEAGRLPSHKVLVWTEAVGFSDNEGPRSFLFLSGQSRNSKLLPSLEKKRRSQFPNCEDLLGGEEDSGAPKKVALSTLFTSTDLKPLLLILNVTEDELWELHP